MTGLRFGRLVGIAFSHTGRNGRAHWLFACDCGAETVADGGNVRGGGTTSCGCLHREVSAARLTVHGHRAGKRHGPTYRAWQTMNGCCGNPRVSGWGRCGGRGIAVTPAWRHDYPAFLADMGERPRGAVLVRRDAEGDFSPRNCVWVAGRTRAERAADGARSARPAAPAGRGAAAVRPNAAPPPAAAPLPR